MRNRLLKSFALFALLAIVFVGCKREPTYKVLVTATEGGTVEGQNGKYKKGDTVVFTAVPADGYYFSKWSDDNTDNPRTITISNKDVTLMAQFAQKPLLTISTSGNGSIETDVNGHYAIGSSVTVTAKPDAGCYFAGWSDGNTDNPRTITIGNEDVSLTALFFAPTVDLGLESGTLWATCNLGAEKSWDYGNYYAWGETMTKDNYDWSTYRYCNGTDRSFTKYCNDSHYGMDGFTDTFTTLEEADDAATAVLGSYYSMPTAVDWEELRSQCYWVWTDSYNGTSKAGYIVYKTKFDVDTGQTVYRGQQDFRGQTHPDSYSLSDAHIFLPAAGDRGGQDFGPMITYGNYWSASLYESLNQHWAFSCYFDASGDVYESVSDRRKGLSIRPVRRK